MASLCTEVLGVLASNRVVQVAVQELRGKREAGRMAWTRDLPRKGGLILSTVRGTPGVDTA